MKRFYRWLVHQSVPHLLRAACFAALIALSSMAYSVISLKPLPVIFAMSVGHGIGILAFCLYLAAVLLDTQRKPESAEAQPGGESNDDSHEEPGPPPDSAPPLSESDRA